MSRIDELQRLHGEMVEAEAKGLDDGGYFAGRSVEAWPAIHRVLVAARALMQCPKCIGPCDDPTVHAEIAEALRALDGEAKP